MALLGALCVGLNALGFTNRSLRAQVSHLLGVAYTVNQTSYDLARLRLNGLIARRPGSNTYDLTPEGQRVAIFYTKVHDRLLRPLIAADAPPAPTRVAPSPARHRPTRPQLRRPRTPRKRRLKTQDKRLSFGNLASLRRSRDFARNGWPLRGSSGHRAADRLTVRWRMDEFSARYADLLTGSYDCVDRIVLNAYYPLGHNPGGFRTWWRRWHDDGDDSLDDAHLMRLAGPVRPPGPGLGRGARGAGDRLRRRGTQAPDRRGLPARPHGRRRGVLDLGGPGAGDGVEGEPVHSSRE